MGRDIAIVGAGIVGICAAWHLQRDGHRVTVFDPNMPGSGTSSGNAGSIATGLSLPIVSGSVLRRLPQMLRDPHGPLVLRTRYLPRAAGWLARLALATRPAKIARTSLVLGGLLDLAESAFEPIVRDARAQALMRKVGRLMIYSNDAAYARSAALRAEWTRRGLGFETLSMEETRELEPALAPRFQHAIFLRDAISVVDPQALVEHFARAFVDAGGRLVREQVRDVPRIDGRRHVVTASARVPTDHVVIAAGAWSKRLCDRLGARVPLETERGYHVMLQAPTPALNRSVLWADQYTHLVPMVGGLRLTSGVEFAGLDAPADFRRIRRLAQHARTLLPTLDATPLSEWLGFRPSLPDSLPVIGPVPGHEDVVLCFGHHHLGLTLGPISGRLVADLIGARACPIDMTPLRVQRRFF